MRRAGARRLSGDPPHLTGPGEPALRDAVAHEFAGIQRVAARQPRQDLDQGCVALPTQRRLEQLAEIVIGERRDLDAHCRVAMHQGLDRVGRRFTSPDRAEHGAQLLGHDLVHERRRRNIEPREVVDVEQLRLTTVAVLQPLPEGGEHSEQRLRVGVRREQRHQSAERDGRGRPRGDDAVSGPAALLDQRRGGRRQP